MNDRVEGDEVDICLIDWEATVRLKSRVKCEYLSTLVWVRGEKKAVIIALSLEGPIQDGLEVMSLSPIRD